MRQSTYRFSVWTILLALLSTSVVSAQDPADRGWVNRNAVHRKIENRDKAGVAPAKSPQPQRVQIPPAAIDTGSAADMAEIVGVVEQGRALEGERRWNEALRYYRDALKANPKQTLLRERLQVVKSQVDVSRRYVDKSYLGSIKQSSRQRALVMLNEILYKVDTYYVHRPSWSGIVDRSVNQLDAALKNVSFLRHHRLSKDDPKVTNFLAELRREYGKRSLRSRQDTAWAADYAAFLAERRLGLPPAAVILEFAAAASSADDYSAFLTPAQLDETFSQIEGNFVGLGVELKVDRDSLLIVHVIEGGPAFDAGIRDGERIVAVNGHTTLKAGAENVADMLRGEEGSVASVDVAAAGKTRTIAVTRRRVEVPSVEKVRILDPTIGLGYFHLTSFQKTTSRDVNEALWKLHRMGMRSLVIDLRGNPGGLLPASVHVADKFLSRGLIVSTRGRSEGEDADYTAHSTGTWELPLYVLIDKDSASASEIFAGAIRDHRRGVVIGERSYGKGSVQGIFRLNNEIGIRLTTAKFYSPNGRAISNNGVLPDVSVELVARVSPEGDVLELSDDPAIRASIDLARKQ